MLEKTFKNEDLGIKMNCYIDKQQNVWFRGKDVAQILGYKDSVNALKRHVSVESKMIQLIQPKSWGGETPPQQNDTIYTTKNVGKHWGGETPPQQNDTRGKYCTFINEPGFYELVFSSKLKFAKKFRQWVFATVLPSIRKYGQYKMFDSPWNKMIMIGNETDLHYKVVQLIRNYYPDSLLVSRTG